MPQTKQVKKIVYAYRRECNISIASPTGRVDRYGLHKPFSFQAITLSSFGYVKKGDLGLRSAHGFAVEHGGFDYFA